MERKVCNHITACRTALMGGIKLSCDQCGYATQQYHSCRDRHCPQCQFRQRKDWCDQQQTNVLPVTYYHVVFTLPHDLNGWSQLPPEVVYKLLFSSVWDTLKTFGDDPKRLDGQLGMAAMLYTLGQNLSQHVHLHCLIPGGALSHQDQWHPAKSNYLFPVRALSKVFRGKMVSALREADNNGELKRITHPDEVNNTLNNPGEQGLGSLLPSLFNANKDHHRLPGSLQSSDSDIRFAPDRNQSWKSAAQLQGLSG